MKELKVRQDQRLEEIIPDLQADAPTRIELKAGNKKLAVIFNVERGRIHSNLENNRRAKPVLGQTTAVYGRAFQLIQEAVDALGKPLEYHFSTNNARMVRWATGADKALSVVTWDQVVYGKQLEDPDFQATKWFRPREGV